MGGILDTVLDYMDGLIGMPQAKAPKIEEISAKCYETTAKSTDLS